VGFCRQAYPYCSNAASGAAIAWDGLGKVPTDDPQPVEPAPRRHARAAKSSWARLMRRLPSPTARFSQSVREQEQTDEIRLRRKLMICRDCVTGESAHDDATGSASR
jgi:hypothetical protein